MAAITAEYPITGDPIVRGDPLTIAVPITVDDGVTYGVPAGWTFRAMVRRWPDGELICQFTTSVGEVTVTIEGVEMTIDALLLDLTGAQTALLHYGDGFDLEQLTPVQRTRWIVHCLRIEKDYSYEGVSST